MAVDNRVSASTGPSGLHRELKVTDAAAFSIGTTGPVAGMALLGVGGAALLGSGVTYAFVFAIVGVSLVAYGFIGLSRYISGVGSVYNLVGRTLGPRAGFIAGFSLFVAYATICTGSTMEIGIFVDKVLVDLNLLSAATEYIWVAVSALVVAVVFSLTTIKVVTRTLLVIEVGAAAIVCLLSLVILIRIGVGRAPGGQTLSWDFLSLPSETGVSTIAAAAVFGFLAFAGFEGAAVLGEETANPRRDIPRAIMITVVLVGAFFLLTIVAQSLGYGTDPAEVARFAGADSPYSDLAGSYVGSAMSTLMSVIAAISLFGVTISTMNGAARVGYSLLRDSGVAGRLTRLNTRSEPGGMIALTGAVALIGMVAQRIAGTAALDATFYWLTFGTLALLVAYAMVTVGAIRFLFLGAVARAPRWQIIVPLLGLSFVLYTIYRNVVGVEGAYRVFPYVLLALLGLAAAVVFAVRGLAERLQVRFERNAQEQSV